MKDITILKLVNYHLAFLWIYQGLFPKLLFINADEIVIWQWMGLSYRHAIWAGQCSGIIEIIFGLLFIFMPTKLLHGLSIFGLFSLFVLVAIVMPDSLVQAFNPVIMNVAMISLSLIYLKITVNPQ